MCKQILVRRIAWITIGTIFTVLALINIHTAILVDLVPSGNDSVGCLVSESKHQHLSWHFYPWIDIAIYCIIPSLIIISSNAVIIVVLIVGNLRRKKMTQNEASNRKILPMLLLLSAFFVVTTLPVSIIFMGKFHVWLCVCMYLCVCVCERYCKELKEMLLSHESAHQNNETEEQNYVFSSSFSEALGRQDYHGELAFDPMKQTAVAFTLLGTCNHSLNFLLYILSGSQFPRQFLVMIGLKS